jgi:hypothetical protein
MNPKTALIAAALLSASVRLATAAQAEQPRPRFSAELAAGPIVGLDTPLRGGAAGLLVALAWGPVEAGLRASAAIDRTLDSASARLDLELGLGGGMRIVVGGIVPISKPFLEPEGAALPLEAAPWPCRFGLSARIADLAPGPFGSRVAVFAGMVYSAYRVAADASSAARAALSGAEAFAACVEVSATIALEWGGGRGTP